VKTMAEVLEEVWDDGNCTGLDGWIGPGRGSAEVDAEALHARERVIQKATAMLTAAGFGPVKAAQADAWDKGYDKGTDLAAWAIGNRPQSERPDTSNPYRAATIEATQ
jgi:hypothetical protein